MKRRLRLGMIGGGRGAFIGAVHRIAARLDDHDELVAGALALVESCPCADGCPACTGPSSDSAGGGKANARRLLLLLSDSKPVSSAA